MPFGRYKGHELNSLPDDYVYWLWRNVELREPLSFKVTEELVSRGLIPKQIESLEIRRLKAVYRELSLKFHPDRGGNNEAMKAINIFFEKLVGIVKKK